MTGLGPDRAGAAARPGRDSPADALRRLRAAAATPLEPAQRRALLDALRRALVARADDVAAALDADYGGRSHTETLLAEILVTADAARFAARHLGRWARPQRVAVPLPFRPASARIEWVPKGVVGIMAPWNYPVQLALAPAIDALAAGNRVAVKPSEHTPRCATLLAELLDAALGPEIAATVLGDAAVAADFAAQPWDHLVFTGGTETGRRVMRAAAEHLTPLTLELGGKCPAVVLPGADLRDAARAILAGKALNAGQTCVAPDTVLLVGHEVRAFAAACRETGAALPETALLGAAQAARLDALAAGAALLPLAEPAAGRRPVTLAEAPPAHPLHREEVFGPLLPAVALPDHAAAVAWIAARPAPLAIYLFGATDAEEAAIAAGTRSGAVVSGRCVDHVAWPTLPFGGIGASGHGRYHGEAGFRAFSNPRARVRHGSWSLSRLLDPPRNERARRLARWLVRQAGR